MTRILCAVPWTYGIKHVPIIRSTGRRIPQKIQLFNYIYFHTCYWGKKYIFAWTEKLFSEFFLSITNIQKNSIQLENNIIKIVYHNNFITMLEKRLCCTNFSQICSLLTNLFFFLRKLPVKKILIYKNHANLGRISGQNS